MLVSVCVHRCVCVHACVFVCVLILNSSSTLPQGQMAASCQAYWLKIVIQWWNTIISYHIRLQLIGFLAFYLLIYVLVYIMLNIIL